MGTKLALQSKTLKTRFTISMDEIEREDAEWDRRAAEGDKLAIFVVTKREENRKKWRDHFDREIIDELVKWGKAK